MDVLPPDGQVQSEGRVCRYATLRAHLRGERAEAAPIGRPAVTPLRTRCPPLMDEVAAATSRNGLCQIDRHALHRRVEAHQRTRGHQHQQHQRQVFDRRLTPLHASHGMDANATCA
jgi:hypothetical protein